MVSAVATRIATSAAALGQSPSPHVPAEDSAGHSRATPGSAASARSNAVILDLSDQARAVLAQARDEAQPPGAGADDLAGLIRFEERFKLMNEYTALHQELAFISDRTAAYALDKTFQGAVAQGESGGEAGRPPAEIDRHLRRRDELMPRFAELTRMLGARPGQDG
ncbi:hypothetical protein [Bosea sp. CS1GBMeth4]|uniref:hypothetical protein n=1 Tax=Bosea sp. CS1GBMeth4 TaxID=1892849 RepID=UPI001644D011|nr:hypothetical protein [Bosea sp. CS1GBMeth4]